MNAIRGMALLLLALAAATPLVAHEVRPAYLELTEITADRFQALWKTPKRGQFRLDLKPKFTSVTPTTPVVARDTADAAIDIWQLRADLPLRGQRLRIVGLDSTMTDALVRIDFIDGSQWVQRLTPGAPEAMIPEHPSALGTAGVYLGLGIEHILLGVDHLLFVLALLLIVSSRRRLIFTVTAFTVAHSITLGLATFSVMTLPPPPVEAVIALSIVFVAAEAIRSRSSPGGIASQAPWLVAFVFGLLHGFGFAGALSEVGLPQVHVPLALLFFNVGVEVGQLLFIATVLAVRACARRLPLAAPRWAPQVTPYLIGSVATFWVFERVAAF